MGQPTVTSARVAPEMVAHCSEWARMRRLEPIATAGRYFGFMLLPLPLPWPRDMSDIPGMSELGPLASARNIRLQAVLGAPDGPPAVILYERDRADSGFRSFARQERVVEPGSDPVHAAMEVLAYPPTGRAADGVVDVLVCTHGRRDRCCGRAGTALYEELCQASGLGGNVRLWRTSHTGGHRFAPTVVVLPEATAWAFADVDLVRAVVSRSGEPLELLDRYRGCCGLRTAGGQLLERLALRERGWDVLDAIRRDQADPDGSCMLSVIASTGAGESATWTGVARQSRPIPMPSCGGAPGAGDDKTTTEWYLGGELDGGE